MLSTPSLDRLRRLAAARHLDPSDEELELLRSLTAELLASCERLDDWEGVRLPVRHARCGGVHVPGAGENRYGAWAVQTEIVGADTGLLAGRRVVLKDIIAVAGVPMSAGSALLRGHVPDYDATVVTRLLDAGGRLVGIAATEDMCLSGASISATTGFVRNPHDPARSAGGSSSGVAALLAAGEADAGIGADQGGSIRIPASLCGIYGLKPTYGLIPYTGCVPIDVSVDHLGPMAAHVQDVARLLEAIAGFDEGLDPRQRADFEVPPYTALLGDGSLAGMRIGLVREGFGQAGRSAPEVDAAVREAGRALGELGAVIDEVSVPEHGYAMDVHASILLQGGSEFMMRGNGIGLPGKGFYDVALAAAAARGARLQSDELFASVKYALVAGGYAWEQFGGAYYAKAQNLAVRLRRAYDAALRERDALALPTTCVTAPLLPPAGASLTELVDRALDPALIANTCAFNHTGHPALSVPVGPAAQMPVGMMLVAGHHADATVLRIAHAMERAGQTWTRTDTEEDGR
jgi:amidase